MEAFDYWRDYHKKVFNPTYVKDAAGNNTEKVDQTAEQLEEAARIRWEHEIRLKKLQAEAATETPVVEAATVTAVAAPVTETETAPIADTAQLQADKDRFLQGQIDLGRAQTDLRLIQAGKERFLQGQADAIQRDKPPIPGIQSNLAKGGLVKRKYYSGAGYH